jgi:hypothetical protein
MPRNDAVAPSHVVRAAANDRNDTADRLSAEPFWVIHIDITTVEVLTSSSDVRTA